MVVNGFCADSIVDQSSEDRMSFASGISEACTFPVLAVDKQFKARLVYCDISAMPIGRTGILAGLTRDVSQSFHVICNISLLRM
jgi:hypothetical protein